MGSLPDLHLSRHQDTTNLTLDTTNITMKNEIVISLQFTMEATSSVKIGFQLGRIYLCPGLSEFFGLWEVTACLHVLETQPQHVPRAEERPVPELVLKKKSELRRESP